MTGVLERGVLRTEIKQQDRTGGHWGPEQSCSGRLPSVSGTIKIFKRPVQIACCHTAWLLSHATTVCHAEKSAHTHAHFTLTQQCQEAPSVQKTSGWWSISRWLASGTLKHFSLSCGAMSLKGHTSVCIPVACALTRQTHAQWPSWCAEMGNVRKSEMLWRLSKVEIEKKKKKPAKSKLN